MNPRFPLYIISKGRYESRITSRFLERMKVPYYIIVEEQEYSLYNKYIDSNKILILDKKYQEEYDTCDSLPYEKSKGSGPARNFAWDHSIKNGFKYHWVIDDNIYGFFRFNRNSKYLISDGTGFRCMEDFVLRYKNVVMAGPNYETFVPRRNKLPPFYLNTRIYSCILIRNDIPFRWRCRYNEDTDLSLRILKEGYCTILFNAFTQKKAQTQTTKGGNTSELYQFEEKPEKGKIYSSNGTLTKSQMMEDLHPDVAKVVWKFSRWHHEVDYSVFKKNKLILQDGLEIPSGINNYNMVLKEFSSKEDALQWEEENV